MKSKATSKVLRAGLIAAVLVVGLVSGTPDKSGRAHATSCYEAMVSFHNANAGYDTARVSYFYGQPTTCRDDCVAQNPTNTHSTVIDQCVEDCGTFRHTAFGEAQTTLFSSSLLTCQPETVDQCAQARAMADQCDAQYDPGQYATPEEYLAVWSQLSACREASKIHMCE